jgi:NADH-quinone oxidoreductase subunit H
MTDAGFAFPWGQEVALSQAVRVPLQLVTFLGKVALLCVIQIQIRWTLPRFRYDQMLGLSWKLLLPASLANLVVTVLVAWWQGGTA